MRGPRRAVRPGIRRPAGEPLLRRRPGFAHLLLPRADRPAAFARRLSGPVPPDRRGQNPDAPAHRNARSGRRQWPGSRHRHAQPRNRQNRGPRRRRRRACHRRVRQRLLSLDQRRRLQRHRHLSRLQARRLLRQSLLHADSSDLHPRLRRTSIQADAHVRIAAQRRPHLGAEQEERHAASDADSGGRARLLSGAEISELRQPRPARHRLPRRQASLR